MDAIDLNHSTYSPVLKWKRGEHRALRQMCPEAREYLYPCIEVRAPSEHSHLVASFHDVWTGAAMVDYSAPNGLMTGWRAEGFKEAVDRLLDGRLSFTPVINPYDQNVLADAAIRSRLAHCDRCAVRVRITDDRTLSELLTICVGTITQLSLSGKSIDLIIDLRAVLEQVNEQRLDRINTALNIMASVGFSKIILIGGAFPETIAQGYSRPQRYDYSSWVAINNSIQLQNLNYGDYSILYPYWEEVQGMRRGKSTIRYALNGEWLVLKGASATKAESINLSDILLSIYSNDFKGAPYSFGDQLIFDRADSNVSMEDKKGGTEYHISEGINHHLTFVLKDDLQLI